MNSDIPSLYVVATPIGHLADITLRAIEVLKKVSLVAAEDTRHSLPLLHHHGIDTELMAVHEHNEAAAAEKIVARISAGESVALISDAGTPGISDPGARVVARVRDAGLKVVPIPGPSAATAAMSVSGLSGAFVFLGFPPAKSAGRKKWFEQRLGDPAHLVCYEAPHRLLESLADCCTVFGNQRRVVIAKEISKLFESFYVGPLGGAADWLAEDPRRQRGEFVFIVEGAPEAPSDGGEEARRLLGALLDEGLPVKQAVAVALRLNGGRRGDWYEMALKIKQAGDNA